MIQYREDGTLVSKETFVDGIPDGPYEYYNHMGIIRQSGETKNYRKHGTIKSYWTSGNIQRVENYKMGVRHGSLTIYEVDGKSLVQTGQYDHNYKVGKWVVYYAKTFETEYKQVKKREETYDHSVLKKITDWNPKGQKVSVSTKLEEGRDMWRNIAWYDMGAKKHDIIYHGKKCHGKWTEWHVNGQKRAEGLMNFDMMEGKWTFWYHNGQKELECDFDFGSQVSVATIYHDNGTIKDVVTS